MQISLRHPCIFEYRYFWCYERCDFSEKINSSRDELQRSHFDQVFSIHCMKYGYSKLFLPLLKDLLNHQLMFIDFPCVIGLLPGRTVQVYKHVFGLLEAAAARLNLTFEPDHIMSDYEKSLIKTVASHVNRTLCI
jgi:hypothetical protein